MPAIHHSVQCIVLPTKHVSSRRDRGGVDNSFFNKLDDSLVKESGAGWKVNDVELASGE